MSHAPPIVLSLIICDSVHVDQGTGKRSLLGCFSAITAKEFPALHPQMHVMVELTNGHGDATIGIKLVRTTADSIDGEEIVGGEAEVTFQDPRAVFAFGLDFRNTVFPQAGEYRLIITSSNVILLERRLLLVQQQ